MVNFLKGLVTCNTYFPFLPCTLCQSSDLTSLLAFLTLHLPLLMSSRACFTCEGYAPPALCLGTSLTVCYYLPYSCSSVKIRANQHFAGKPSFQTTAYVHTYGTTLARICQNPHQARATPRTRTPLPDLPSTGQCLLHATYHSHHNQPIHPPHTCNPEFTNPALLPTSFVLLTTITTKTHSLHNSNTPRTHATHTLPIPPSPQRH